MLELYIIHVILFIDCFTTVSARLDICETYIIIAEKRCEPHPSTYFSRYLSATAGSKEVSKMRTQKTIVLAAMLLIVSMALTPAFAQATVQAESIGSQSAQINTEDTIITDAELETVEEEFNDPGMLPNHPFYGFKRFGESLSDVFTFDKIAKAKMHLERAKIRLAEAKALIELKEQEL